MTWDSDMAAYPRRWILRRSRPAQWRALQQEFDLHPLTAQLLFQRGFSDLEELDTFLNPSLAKMHDPFLMKDMGRAVYEVLLALDGGQRIVIHGDYDVDGICSVSVLYSFLRALGANVSYFIPTREQNGYGIAEPTVRRLAQDGNDLLISTDCGVSNVDEIALARELGMRVVVVDHHTVPEILPPANAILNPLQRDCNFPFKQLAAVGVTFNFVVALRKELRSRGVFAHVKEPDIRALLDLVAMGTIADVMPLVGENRIFVRSGLEILGSKKRPGIAALLERIGRPESQVNTETVSYGIAPRLNAAGRIGDASICVELLTTRSYQRALQLAERLDAMNRRRQEVERGILDEALAKAQAEVDLERKILLIAGVDWPGGVLGIVASRLTERYHRPAIIVSIQDGVARGSARSIEGFDILDLLRQSDPLLSTYGGHTAAAGLSFAADNLEALRDALNQSANVVLKTSGLPTPQIVLDGSVELGDLDERFVRDLARLAPFGMANAEPIFLAEHTIASRARVVGSDHLRARFRDDTAALDAIGFSLADRQPLLSSAVAIAFSPRHSTFRGRARLEMHLRDIRSAVNNQADEVFDALESHDAPND
ncbi:single-stranded-DNA-specific exonuclease RecJ [Bradymonas sediminis]|uniref:Single-stranded-DNA-specific exonuclease RecJ n=2 Tax=Bradymonas sediminis TaxID=1548548 RepID=A0A2Z4FL51_9DELT|nr:single-stranded-DNA-specific exonuclease RecJ [Bradymonas sediminis]